MNITYVSTLCSEKTIKVIKNKYSTKKTINIYK